MHRKQAKFFGKLHPKFEPPCYLKPEQKQEFESQFTLFDEEIDLKKLRQTMEIQGYQKHSPMIYEFITELCDKSEKDQNPKINFSEYLEAIDRKLSPAHKQGSMMFKLLVKDSTKNTIGAVQFIEIMKEIGDKQFSVQEAHELMGLVVGKATTEISQQQFNLILQRRVNSYN